ncbi:MAG: 2-C-methyl-D-erythritol 2,4-cyclodiphosphate synthase [Gemmataceae bacterium]
MIRVGIGYDTHRLAPGRPLVLGGVHIEHPRGLVGHSDADVVLHALTDAILGAAGLGDIGDAFPDTDAANKDRDSADFLRAALDRIRHAGWSVGNVDANVIAQEPKLGPLKARMRERIAALLEIDPAQVNVKAKTGEGIGSLGRAEGIACQVVVLLSRAEAGGAGA